MPTYDVNLVPAYGRDYKTEEQVKRDWLDGKDFQIRDVGSPYNGRYTSIRDWEGKWVRIRFARLAEIVIVYGGDDENAKSSIFRDHSCWKCQDGKLPCVRGSYNNCEYPHARND